MPTFLFINKMDLAGADRAALLAELKAEARTAAAWTSARSRTPLAGGGRRLRRGGAGAISGNGGAAGREPSPALIAERKLFPCCFGSALKVEGVEELLWPAWSSMPPGRCYPAEFGAKVFKITRDAQGARLTHLKITGGSTAGQGTAPDRPGGGDGLAGKGGPAPALLRGQIPPRGRRRRPGTVCAVTGLSRTCPGQGLGIEPDWTGPGAWSRC